MSEQNENTKQINIEKEVMEKILSNKVRMKPKWYFVGGSVLSILGLSGFFITSAFLTNILIFLAHKRGPGVHRLEYMIENFPVWLPFAAILAALGGIFMLKKFEFSYKANFKIVVLGFLLSVLLGALIINLSGLNDIWSKRGPIKNFYEKRFPNNKRPNKNPHRQGKSRPIPNRL